MSPKETVAKHLVQDSRVAHGLLREPGVREPPETNVPEAESARWHGLTQTEAQRRLAEFGFNEPVTGRAGGPFAQFLHFCTNPLVLIGSA